MTSNTSQKCLPVDTQPVSGSSSRRENRTAQQHSLAAVDAVSIVEKTPDEGSTISTTRSQDPIGSVQYAAASSDTHDFNLAKPIPSAIENEELVASAPLSEGADPLSGDLEEVDDAADDQLLRLADSRASINSDSFSFKGESPPDESSANAIKLTPNRTDTAERPDASRNGKGRDEIVISNAPYNAGAEPWTVDDELPEEFREMTLDDAIELGLRNSKVLRSLGGAILQNPQATTSIYEPGLRITDPVLGEEAALSQFDTQLQSNMTYQNNDNVFNSAVSNGGINNGLPFELQQDLYNWNLQLQKTSASGTQFSVNRTLTHDNNDAPQNAFSHAWNSSLEATIRTPLLQGGGVEFNRIAGPNGQPGFRFTNGVIIAQIDGRLSIAEFEQSVQSYLSELVSSYWQLYLAYRNYESAIRARETAHETWRVVEARYFAELEGGEADREAQAREQLLAFNSQVLTALSGDSRTGSQGVYQAEANLRRLTGLRLREDQFIKPIDSPTEARTIYDWQHLTTTASQQRPELCQQKLRVRQRELEMLASKNFLLPRLDAFATYRFNGFGDDLLGGGPGRFSDTVKDFYSGDHQESEFGLQLSMPIGFRREYAAYRNAQLTLQRERAILAEQHEQIYYDLGNALRQVALDYRTMQNAYNRLEAADQAVQSRLASFEADKIPLDSLLEAQERRAQAENAYHQTVVNYELSQVQVETESGNLLNRYGVSFSDVY